MRCSMSRRCLLNVSSRPCAPRRRWHPQRLCKAVSIGRFPAWIGINIATLLTGNNLRMASVAGTRTTKRIDIEIGRTVERGRKTHNPFISAAQIAVDVIHGASGTWGCFGSPPRCDGQRGENGILGLHNLLAGDFRRAVSPIFKK